MIERLLAKQIKGFVLQLFEKPNAHRIQEWEALTTIEHGILSWYLGNFYCSLLWWIEEPT